MRAHDWCPRGNHERDAASGHALDFVGDLSQLLDAQNDTQPHWQVSLGPSRLGRQKSYRGGEVPG